MMKKFVVSATFLVASLACQANAGTFNFNFNGPGVSGAIALTYGPAMDAKYPSAFEVTGISGTFTDTNNSLDIINATITALVPIEKATPEPSNLLAPDSFSKFAVASGLPPQSHNSLSYTNLFWPDGSPQTASDYPPHGGFLDIYGLLFRLDNGMVVNLWSNGDADGSGHIDYGVAVVEGDTARDYTFSGLSIVPEPSSFTLLGIAMAGVLAWRRDSFRSRLQG